MSFSQYKRVLLKLSGDILKGNEKSGIDFNLVGRIAEEIKRVSSSGIEVCIVVGGGNLFRGSEAEKIGYDRIIADNMGMLSTVINAMAIQNALENTGIQSRVMSAIGIQELVELVVALQLQLLVRMVVLVEQLQLTQLQLKLVM